MKNKTIKPSYNLFLAGIITELKQRIGDDDGDDDIKLVYSCNPKEGEPNTFKAKVALIIFDEEDSGVETEFTVEENDNPDELLAEVNRSAAKILIREWCMAKIMHSYTHVLLKESMKQMQEPKTEEEKESFVNSFMANHFKAGEA